MARHTLPIDVARVRHVVLLAAMVIYAICFQVVPNLPRGQLLALGTFLASGRAIRLGLPPYGSHPQIYEAIGSSDFSPNLNPPVLLPLFQHVAWLDPQAAFRGWFGITVMLYLLALVLVCRGYPENTTVARVVLALSSVGLWATLREGQVYVPLALATVGAWFLLRRGHAVTAGLLIGALVAIKPNYAVWPVLLLLAGYWPATLASGIATVALSLAPVALYGIDVYAGWFRVLPHGQALASPVNASLTGLATRFGVAPIGEAASVALLLALAWWAWRRKPDVLQLSSVALVASMLASPLSWLHYTVILLPVLWSRRWTSGWWACALLLLVPDYLLWDVYFKAPHWIWAAGVVSTGTLILLLTLLVRPSIPAWAHRPHVRPALAGVDVPSPIAAE